MTRCPAKNIANEKYQISVTLSDMVSDKQIQDIFQDMNRDNLSQLVMKLSFVIMDKLPDRQEPKLKDKLIVTGLDGR